MHMRIRTRHCNAPGTIDKKDLATKALLVKVDLLSDIFQCQTHTSGTDKFTRVVLDAVIDEYRGLVHIGKIGIHIRFVSIFHFTDAVKPPVSRVQLMHSLE